MDLSDSKKQIARRAARDLALKLQLESIFKPTLRRFFKELIAVFNIKYRQGGSKEVVNVDDFYADLVGILRAHYRRVARAFINIDAKQIKMIERKDTLTDGVNVVMAEYILEHSKTQSKVILQTVKNELDEAILKSIQEAVQNNIDPDPDVIAKLVTDDFLKKIDGKAEIIAITETQNIAEKTKEEQYRALSQVGDPTTDIFVKQWVSILDGKTRPWHARADGQRVGISEPFIVKGERLMYPGDTTFGVSLDNIINCRCSSLLVRLDQD